MRQEVGSVKEKIVPQSSSELPASNPHLLKIFLYCKVQEDWIAGSIIPPLSSPMGL